MPAYKNDAGRWYCAFYYKDWTGKRRKKKKESFGTKREALEWEREFLDKYAGTPEITFATLANAYLESAKLRLKPQTYYTKRNITRNHLLPFFGDMIIGTIDRRVINCWREELLRAGYKTTYLRTIHAQLSSILNYAMEYYGLPSNPSEAVSGFSKHTIEKMDFWTLEEFQRFAMSALQLPHHIMAFYLLFWTGMRVGEMLALTWDDVDFKTNSISITKTLYRLQKTSYVSTTKTISGDRTIIMPRFIAEMLQDYRRLSAYTSEERIIPITRAALLKKLHEGAKKAGVKEIRIHDLRHSHASLLIKAHCTPVEVADRLGHKDPSITLKIYSHMYAAQRTKIADMLDDMRK